MGEDWTGLLLVDKPQGPTSHDIVDQVRRLTGQRRIGHAGTLDPMATGLLPLVLGRATRLVRYIPHSPKVYRGTIRLGLTTASDDVTGETLTVAEGPLPDADEVLAASRAFCGRLDQRPPAVSARRVGGQRLYRLAREGKSVDAPSATIEVGRFDLEPTDRAETYVFEAEVSAGTYIRAIARDLGARLGCGGTLASLSRTRIGPMRIEDAAPAANASAGTLRDRLIPLEGIPLDLPPIRLGQEEQARRFALGGVFEILDLPSESGPYRVLGPTGTLLGIAETNDGKLQPRVVIAPHEAP